MVWGVDGACAAGVELGKGISSGVDLEACARLGSRVQICVGGPLGGNTRMTSKVASQIAVIILRYLGFFAFGDVTQAPRQYSTALARFNRKICRQKINFFNSRN